MISFGTAALLGVLAGVAVPKLFCMGDGSYAGFFSLYSFGKFTQLPDTGFAKLFWYLAVKRLRLFFFLWMGSYTPLGFLLHLLLGFWTFFACSMLLSLFLLREGTNGMLLFLCCLLPQWILYALAFRAELRQYFMRYGSCREGSGGMASDPEAEAVTEYGREKLVSDLEGKVSGRLKGETASMLTLCLAGCGMEAFIGLRLLQVFLQLV